MKTWSCYVFSLHNYGLMDISPHNVCDILGVYNYGHTDIPLCLLLVQMNACDAFFMSYNYVHM